MASVASVPSIAQGMAPGMAPGIAQEVVYKEDAFIKVREPAAALAPGAIEIVVLDNEKIQEVSDSIYSVYATFKCHIDAYPLYYQESCDARTNYASIQVVPYPNNLLGSLITQVRVVFNTFFPWSAFPWSALPWLASTPVPQEGLAELFKKSPLPLTTLTIEESDPKKCVFCKNEKARIKAQKIPIETLETDFCVNFRPIRERDYLVASKIHRRLSERISFVEARTTCIKAKNELAAKGYPISFLTFSDHPRSGQTVPHAHMHLTLGKNWGDALLAGAVIVRKIFIDWWVQMAFPTFATLTDSQLKDKIENEERPLLQNAFPELKQKAD